jgi:hypothetical protein
MTTPADPATVEELREAQRREYGQYVAKVPIDIDGGRAFNPGDPVPASHIQRGVVDKDQVVGASTKTAAAVTSEKG